MINEELVRREYGYLGKKIHANACSVAVPPRRVHDSLGTFMEHYMAMVYDSGHVGFDWLRQKVRGQIAELIHVTPEEIAFTKNTTEGTAILAWGYPMKSNENVVVADLENPSNLFPWVMASKKRGYGLNLVKTDGRGVTLQNYLDAIDENTRIVAVSSVQAGSGARIDLEALGKYCHAHGIILSVDAIQGMGRLVIDAEKYSIDYLSCGGYKGLGAGFGVGFLYCRKELAHLIEPFCTGDGCTVEELSAPEVYREEMELHYFDNSLRFEGGSSNTLGIWMMHHALTLQEEFGKENIEEHVLELERMLREKIAGCGLDILPQSDLPSGMVVAWYPKENYEAAEEILNKYDIHISHHEGYLRLSLSVLNTKDQIDIIAKAYKEIGTLK